MATKPLPPPPIPQGVKDQLADYPSLLEQLQLALNDVLLKPSPATPPFELAVWALEDCLDSFAIDAQGELRKAEDAGDAMAAMHAEKKRKATSLARSSGYGMRDLDELESYFANNRRHSDVPYNGNYLARRIRLVMRTSR